MFGEIEVRVDDNNGVHIREFGREIAQGQHVPADREDEDPAELNFDQAA